MHVLEEEEKLGNRYDHFILLEPTHPIRKKLDVDEALKLHFAQSNGVTISVAKTNKNPEISIVSKGNNFHKLFKNKKTIFRRQDEEVFYHPYGGIFIAEIESYKKNNDFYNGNFSAYVIEDYQRYDIDEEHDFLAAEKIYKWALDSNLL